MPLFTSKASLLLAALLALAGCSSHSIQTSSGADYLARYAQTDTAPGASFQRSAATDGSTDALVRQAAAVEPILRFPARFGLARIDRGHLTTIPESEAFLWREIAKKYAGLGEFVALDPFVAEFTAQSLIPSGARAYGGAADLIAQIRLGGARQHLDAVMVYEVGVNSANENTALAFADLTIIGGAFLPTRSLDATAVARALLIDVRNGYPYGTADAAADVSELSTSWGSDGREQRLRHEAAQQAAEALAPEVDAMLAELVVAMKARSRPAR